MAAKEATAQPAAAPGAIPAAQLDPTKAAQQAEEERGLHSAPRLTQSVKPLGPETVCAALNAVRQDPASVVPRLEARRLNEQGQPRYVGKRYYPEGEGGDAPAQVTLEGEDALNDACRTLSRGQAVGGVVLDPVLSGAAAAHLADICRNDTLAHTGEDGSKPADRVARVGTWQGVAGEVIAVSVHPASAEELLELVCINDGDKTRHDRRAILNPGFTKIGVATGEHPRFSSCAVIVMVGGFSAGITETDELEAACEGAPASPDVQRILDATPIEELVEEVQAQLQAGASVSLKWTPGKLEVKVRGTDGAGEEYEVEWEHEAARRAPTVPVARDPY